MISTQRGAWRYPRLTPMLVAAATETAIKISWRRRRGAILRPTLLPTCGFSDLFRIVDRKLLS
jgi:hypothetical protein